MLEKKVLNVRIHTADDATHIALRRIYTVRVQSMTRRWACRCRSQPRRVNPRRPSPKPVSGMLSLGGPAPANNSSPPDAAPATAAPMQGISHVHQLSLAGIAPGGHLLPSWLVRLPRCTVRGMLPDMLSWTLPDTFHSMMQCLLCLSNPAAGYLDQTIFQFQSISAKIAYPPNPIRAAPNPPMRSARYPARRMPCRREQRSACIVAPVPCQQIRVGITNLPSFQRSSRLLTSAVSHHWRALVQRQELPFGVC